MMTFKEVRETTRLTTGAINQLVNAGLFPRPVSSDPAPVWERGQVMGWLDGCTGYCGSVSAHRI